jgi:hypothetical protein
MYEITARAKVINQIPVKLHKVAHEGRLTMLLRVDEPKVRLQLSPKNGPVNLPLQHRIGQIEDVVSSIIGLELLTLLRP